MIDPKKRAEYEKLIEEVENLSNSPQKESVKEYKNRYNPQLEPHGIQIVNTNTFRFWKIATIFLFVILIASAGTFFYFVYKGYFQMSQPINLQNNVTMHNDYSFNPSTTNDNQYTIYNNVTIPVNVVCGNQS
jgi:hypothetical protein